MSDHYGGIARVQRQVPESGEITLNDISDVKPADGDHISCIRANQAKTVSEVRFHRSDTTEHFTFRCPPQAGDMRRMSNC